MINLNSIILLFLIAGGVFLFTGLSSQVHPKHKKVLGTTAFIFLTLACIITFLQDFIFWS